MQSNNPKQQEPLTNEKLSQKTSLEDNDKINLVIDASQYQNVKVPSSISWFHSILAVSLTIIGVFLGIIMCCLIIIFV